MSYDYNALVQEFERHHTLAWSSTDDTDDATTNNTKLEHLSQALVPLEGLSQACPMTPRLWMQYALDLQELLNLQQQETKETSNNKDNQVQRATLQLGLAEFPGCALLHHHYLSLLVSSEEEEETVEEAFQEAFVNVGQGSHGNQGNLVASIYRLYADYLVSKLNRQTTEDDKNGIQKQLVQSFVQRCRIPMKDANDAIVDEFQTFLVKHNVVLADKTGVLQELDHARRLSAKLYGNLQMCEEEVDAALHAEQILLSNHIEDLQEWTHALLVSNSTKPEDSRILMGLGGNTTAFAFQAYAQKCSRFTLKNEDEENDDETKQQWEETIQSLALAVYERGAAECPTVESLWWSYLKHLLYLVVRKQTGPAAQLAASRLATVARRAVRNCPYSITLVQLQMQAALALAEAGRAVLDPDSLVTMVQEVVQAKFIVEPAQILQLYRRAIQTIKRRILSLLSAHASVHFASKHDSDKSSKPLAYDDAEPPPSSKKKKNASPADPEETPPLADAVEEEVQDLLEDLRDLYDTADHYLRKHHVAWSEGRALLWKDRAMTEACIVSPLLSCLKEANTDDDAPNRPNSGGDEEAVKAWEKVVRVHQPPHPDSYAGYIQYVLHDRQSVSSPAQVIQRLRRVRALYQKAISSVSSKNKEETASLLRDRQAALHSLCHEYLEFEELFGSDESHTHASTLAQKKLNALATPAAAEVAPASTMIKNETATSSVTGGGEGSVVVKRKAVDVVTEEPLAKRAKASKEDSSGTLPMDTTGDDNNAVPVQASEKKTTLKVPPKHPVHKVRVGKLDYPAHPFTVRVTNLAEETEDMDLVDVFRPKCGEIVHAKIVRDKHHFQHGKAKSKGWGLIQFEERESVDKALELNDVIGIHEKIVKVGRSHVRAVNLVPPGMHRVNPKGEGKSTKRNEKRREKQGAPGGKQNGEDSKGTNTSEKKKDNGGTAAILAFRPRGIGHGHGHRKVHLSIASDEKKK